MSDRTRIFWFGRTEPEPKPKAPNPNRTRTEPHSSKMGTFWHKNYFHPSNTKIESKKPSNLAKELWENARDFIVSEAMKNKFQPIFAFFSNSKVENCWYYGILVRLWFGWPNQLVRWFGRTSPNRLVRPNPNPNRTVRSLTNHYHYFNYIRRCVVKVLY